jgi:hypothetical protein
VVTTRYPEGRDPWAVALPTPPLFDPRRLTAKTADQVVEVCPSGALALGERAESRPEDSRFGRGRGRITGL